MRKTELRNTTVKYIFCILFSSLLSCRLHQRSIGVFSCRDWHSPWQWQVARQLPELVAPATGRFWQLPEFVAAATDFLVVSAVCSVKLHCSQWRAMVF